MAAYNRTTSKVDDFLANEAKGTNVVGAHSIEEFVSLLKRPRKVILLVKAGPAVDAFIEQLVPHLEKGDIIIDGHHHNLYHGSGAHYSDDQVRRLVDHLLNQKVLAEYSSKTRFQRFANYYLQLGPNASKLLQGHMSVRVDMPSNPSIGAASTSRRSNTSTALHGPTSVRAESPSSSDDMDLTFISLSPHRMKTVAAPAAAHQSVSTAPSSGVLVGKKGTAASKTTSPARPLADRTNRLATGPVATPHVHIAAMPLRKPPVRRK